MAAPGLRGNLKTQQLTLAAAGTQVIEAAVAGKLIEVVSFSFGISVNTALPSFESSAGTVLAGPYDGASPIFPASGRMNSPLFWTAIGEGLTFRTAGAGLVKGHITYRIVSV